MRRNILKILIIILLHILLLYATLLQNIQRGDYMPNIKPVSDLRNYNEVLQNVDIGQPVFLTKNGRGRYAVLDIRDYEKTQATLKLISKLSKGEQSAIEKGWQSADDVEARLGVIT